jgi:glycerophosphoryl diester phosphodiesterase
MKILGHRGASANFPENTLEAFIGAAAEGADGVELDVMQCASGELVVCHDEWLDRVARKHWELGRKTLFELKSLDVGSPLGFAPARLPTLGEVFDALEPTLLVNVEIKCDVVDDQGLSEKVGAFVTQRGLQNRVLLSSFNPLCLLRVARAYPSLRRGLLLDPDKSWALQAWGWLPIVSNASVHPHFSQCTAERVNRWHSLNLEVAVWTVDDPQEAKRLRAMGVEHVITNRPGALRTELESL